MINSGLFSDEDDGFLVGLDALDELREDVLLLLVDVVAVDKDDALLDRVNGRKVKRPDEDGHRVGHVGRSQPADLRGPSGAGHHRLTIGADVQHDFTDLGFEAHVEHSVGLQRKRTV